MFELFCIFVGAEANKLTNEGSVAADIRRIQKAEALSDGQDLHNKALISMKQKNETINAYFQGVNEKKVDETIGKMEYGMNMAIGVLRDSSNHNNRRDDRMEQQKQLLRDFKSKMDSSQASDIEEVRRLGMSLSLVPQEQMGQYVLTTLKNKDWLQKN